MQRYSDTRKSSESNESKVNLTPMLDVVFIMLIFFIVTATFTKEHGIDVNPPSENANPRPDLQRNIVVQIRGNDQLVVDRRLADQHNIRAHLERQYAQYPKAGLVIDAHPNSTTLAMVKVMDTARSVGIEDIQLADRY